MAPSEARRRASYGPTSPIVGERGARTRSHVVAVALELFAEQGFHATLVEDIARRAGVSRATMYQYFASKEQLFVELVEESGAALMRDVRALGPLGPTAEGFAGLRWWLEGWARSYDAYATVFVEWAHVSSPKASLQPLLARFTDAYTARLADHFARAGVAGVDLRGAALVLFTVVERFEYMRHTRRLARSDADLAASLAVAAQLFLFPATPREVLAGAPATPPGRQVAPGTPGRPGDGDAVTGSRSRPADPGHATRDQLLAAGARVVGELGFHGASVDQVVTQAGLARGTFYKYFRDKLELVQVLAEACLEELAVVVASIPAARGPGAGAALREWLDRYDALHQRYAGVFRVWSEETPSDAVLDRTGWAAVHLARTAVEGYLGSVDHTYPFDPYAPSLMVLGLLERFPGHAAGSAARPDRRDALELMAVFVERGLLDHGAPDHQQARAAERR